MSLMLHAGGTPVSYDDLRAISTPLGTDSHVPVPHHEVVELVRYTLGFYGHEIAEESHAITQDGAATSALCPYEARMATTPTPWGCATRTIKVSPSALPLGAACLFAIIWLSSATRLSGVSTR